MLSITEIQLESLVTHYVGNNSVGDVLELSKSPVTIESPELKNILLQYFLSPFREAGSFNLWHPSSVAFNDIFLCAAAIFLDPKNLMIQSCNIARHLYDVTVLPNIKSGELHIVYFKGCPIDGIITDAIGIYKMESKDQFLTLDQSGNNYQFHAAEGIDPTKMGKGCIIFNTQGDKGFKVFVIDKSKTGSDASFWKDTFLKVRAADDEFHKTQDYMKMCKDFIVEQIPSEFEVSRVEQIDFLNKTADFFKKNEQLSQEEFEQTVIKQPELIESLRSYGKQFQDDYEVNFSEGFDISNEAVKKQSKSLKKILKLDKNFHLYIHGSSELIEKGYDEKVGMNYYKVYFEEEA